MTGSADFTAIYMFSRDHRDNDQLVKLFTREYGKKMFFLKDAKKAGYRLAASVLPFSHGVYSGFIRDTGLSYINAEKNVKQYENIFQDIELNAYATYILNLVDAAFEDNDAQPKWFDVVDRALTLIDNGIDFDIVTNLIQIQLVSVFGVQFNWAHCVECGRNDLPLDFSEKFGGMLCSNHWELDPHRWHLSTKTSQILALLSQTSIFNLNNVSVSQETKNQIWELLDSIYQNQVGIRLKSKSFIDQMKKWNV